MTIAAAQGREEIGVPLHGGLEGTGGARCHSFYRCLHTLILRSRIAGCGPTGNRGRCNRMAPGGYQRRSQRTFGEIDHESGSYRRLIPIVAITFGIGIGCLAIWSEHKRKLELIDRLHRERMLALEKGVEPPPAARVVGHLASNAVPLPAPRMRNGLMLLFGGIVLYFAVDNAGGEEGASVHAGPGRPRSRQPDLRGGDLEAGKNAPPKLAE